MPPRASSARGPRLRLSWVAGAVLLLLCITGLRSLFTASAPRKSSRPPPDEIAEPPPAEIAKPPPDEIAKPTSSPKTKEQKNSDTKKSPPTASLSGASAKEEKMTDGMIWLDDSAGWTRKSTFSDAIDLCETRSLLLCNYDQYCPKGKTGGVAGGAKPGDQWAPYKGDGDNAWVQIGTWLKAPLTCLPHHKLPGKDGFRPEWGSEPTRMSFKNFIACCPDTTKKPEAEDEKSEQHAAESGKDNPGKEDQADDGDGTDEPSNTTSSEDDASTESSRSTLEALSKGELMVKAASLSVSEEKLESAINGTKEMLIDLILESEASVPAPNKVAGQQPNSVVLPRVAPSRPNKRYKDLNGSHRATAKMGWFQYQQAPQRMYCENPFAPVSSTPHAECRHLHRRRRTDKSFLKCQSKSCPCGENFQYANPYIKARVFNRRVMPTSKYAVCKLPRFGYQLYAFQHAIQYLYKCWSWWQLHPNAEHILDDHFQNQRPGKKDGVTLYPRSSFLVEIIEVFRRAGVKIYNSENKPERELRLEFEKVAMVPERHSAYPRDPESWFQCVQHSRTLVDAIKPGAYDGSCTNIEPRIAILNRRGTRKLKNPSHIAMRLEQEFKEVRVYYFENKTFVQQLSFMTKTDILFTPSGAQVSLVFAMPRCGALLLGLTETGELIHYFSTMATDSGIISSRVWMAGGKGGDNCIDPTYVVTKVRYLQKMRYDCLIECLNCNAR